MDLRKIVVQVIPIFFLLTYFYITTSSYLKYQTVSNVRYLKHTSELPPIETLFCVLNPDLMVILPGSKSLNGEFWRNISLGILPTSLKLFVNQKTATLNVNQILIGGQKCWKMNIEPNPTIVLEMIEANATENLSLRSFTLRNIESRTQYDAKNIQIIMERSELVPIHQMIIYRSLVAPYDTKCVDYEVSQNHCWQSCTNAIRGISYRDRKFQIEEDKCSIQCSRDDCLLLKLHTIFSYVEEYSFPRVFYGDKVMSIRANELFATSLYFQIVIGLVTMFCEVTVLDLKRPIYKAIFFVFRIKKLKAIRPIAASIARNIIRKLLSTVVIIGCISHTTLTTMEYMRYHTSSEMFVGSPRTLPLPNIGICYDHELPINSSYSTIRSKIIKFENLVEVMYPGKMRPSNVLAYFHNSQSCYLTYPVHKFFHSSLGGTIVNIKMKKSGSYEFYSTFVDDVPRNMPHAYMVSNFLVRFEASISMTSSLPHPYDTNCVNYSAIGYQSQYQCRDSCIIHHHSRIYGTFPRSVDNKDNFTMLISNLKHHIEECDGACFNDDCTKSTMDFNLIGGEKSTYLELSVSSSKQFININVSPRQSLPEFFTYTVSLLSLWLGLNGLIIVKIFDMMKLLLTTDFDVRGQTLIVLVICFSIHCYILIVSYMKYDILSIVRMGSIREVTLPAVSLVVRMTNKTTSYGFQDDISYHEMAPVEVDRVFWNSTLLMSTVGVMDPNMFRMDTIDFDDLAYSETYIVNSDKVITMPLDTLNSKIYRYNGFKVRRRQNLICIYFRLRVGLANERKFKLPPEISALKGVALHQGNYIQSVDRNETIPFVGATLSYDVSIVQLLKYPYHSNCIDYHDPVTNQNSYFRCIIDRHMTKYGKIPCDLPVPNNWTQERMLSDIAIKDFCIARYNSNPPCKSIDYLTSFSGYNDQADVVITPPSKETKCLFVPKTSFFDLTILLAECIDIWLGISFCVILRQICKLTKFGT